MIALDELFDLLDLDAAIDSGYVRQQYHPTLPLAILNYSEHCQFERVWTPVTRQCRGLIYNTETGLVVARPLPKFFNYGEPGLDLDPEEPVLVTDKLDGSLGILYDDGDGGAVATRGSFTSDQAQHATAVWKRRYAGRLRHVHLDWWTLLFEIIYPQNRIVCDYRGADDLYLLGSVYRSSGDLVRPGSITWWPGPKVAEFSEYRTLSDAVAAPRREGAEGFVVDLLTSKQRVKIKQADYVVLHRIVTGLSTRTVWEHLAEGRALAELIDQLPDEFHAWVGKVAGELNEQVVAIRSAVEIEHARILAGLPVDWTRKDYALVAKEHQHSAALFRHLDGRSFADYCWKLVKPEREMAAPGAPVRDEAVA